MRMVEKYGDAMERIVLVMESVNVYTYRYIIAVQTACVASHNRWSKLVLGNTEISWVSRNRWSRGTEFPKRIVTFFICITMRYFMFNIGKRTISMSYYAAHARLAPPRSVKVKWWQRWPQRVERK